MEAVVCDDYDFLINNVHIDDFLYYAARNKIKMNFDALTNVVGTEKVKVTYIYVIGYLSNGNQ